MTDCIQTYIVTKHEHDANKEYKVRDGLQIGITLLAVQKVFRAIHVKGA